MELSKKQVNEYKKQFVHISENAIKDSARNYKTTRGLLNALQTKNENAKNEHEKPLPVDIVITVTWNKNRFWGMNPTASVSWTDENGAFHSSENCGHASGCGYDKLTAAIAEALNANFKNLLYKNRRRNLKNKPYGLCYYAGSFPQFEGGVGISCYPRIFDFLGYKWTETANGKTFNVFHIYK